MDGLTRHLRILRPAPGVLAFYDGRVEGHRFAEGPNWVDDGALSLGIASYAVIDGGEALVYDTHVSRAHAAAIRRALAAEGVARITVVLSHWHLDHVAGTAEFADCEVIANGRTAAHLAARRAAIEAGTDHGPPAIAPLILPTRSFDGRLPLRIGARQVELIAANIHSDDATVLWLPEARLLLAGDTLEDTVTYVGEPEAFATHLTDLERLAELGPAAILPNHGDPDRIAAGGYPAGLIGATQDYIRWLLSLHADPLRAEAPLAEVVAKGLREGVLSWFAPYEEVHRQNVARVLEMFRARDA